MSPSTSTCDKSQGKKQDHQKTALEVHLLTCLHDHSTNDLGIKQIFRCFRPPEEPLPDLDLLRCQKCQKYLQLPLSRILPVPASHAQYNREPAISVAALSSLGHSSDLLTPTSHKRGNIRNLIITTDDH